MPDVDEPGFCPLQIISNNGEYLHACGVSCDVIYYVIAVRARRMVCIFFLPYLGNRSESDPCSYELFCLASHILSFPKVLQIPPELPCICILLHLVGFLQPRITLHGTTKIKKW